MFGGVGAFQGSLRGDGSGDWKSLLWGPTIKMQSHVVFHEESLQQHKSGAFPSC